MEAGLFNDIALQVLHRDDIQNDMRHQEIFYETVRRKMDEGFRGRHL
ncbi:MAG: hypothetical protein Greene041619_615 [Candidatus Peregrinibacteria bacterium Greene0416_19]|nr:MAG: hypothetical protein Greene041619_615 [Candidatus Peregrinibacteria bacterium Greene0416_19]